MSLPALDDITANEIADAPKTKARECLARKAMLPQPVVLSFGFGWRAPLVMSGCLLANNFRDRAPPLVSRSSWLRRVAGTVNNTTAQFISIVKCNSWIAHRSNYTSSWSGTSGTQQQSWRHLQEVMSEAPEKMPKIRRLRGAFSPSTAAESTAANCLQPSAKSSSRMARTTIAYG